MDDNDLRLLASKLTTNGQLSFDPTTLKKAKITAVNLSGPPPTVTLLLSGSTVSIPGVRIFSGYLPVVNDIVLVLKQRSDLLVLGRVETKSYAWAGLSLQNGWVVEGGAIPNPSFRHMPDNTVMMRGAAKDGTTTFGILLGTLPVGYRPSYKFRFWTTNIDGGTTPRQVHVDTDGSLYGYQLAGGIGVSFDGVRFPMGT